MHSRMMLWAAFLGALLVTGTGFTQTAPMSLTLSNDGTKTVQFPLVPALDAVQLSTGATVTATTPVNPGFIRKDFTGYTFSVSNRDPRQFYKLQYTQMSSNALFVANLLNRIAYGPTPDEIERVTAIGPDAYINEQLEPASLPPSDSYVAVSTNGVSLPPTTTWTVTTVTGLVTSSTLYMYLTGVGQVSLDDVQMRYSYVFTGVTNSGGVLTTNVTTNLTANLVVNGDFEQPLNTGWTVSPNLSGSYIDTTRVCSGASSLRMVASAPGSTQTNSIWQTMAAAPVTTRGTNGDGSIYTNTISNLRSILSFAYLPSPNSHMLLLRLSGSGTITSADDEPPTPEWVYATATGPATATGVLYVYLTGGAGEVYVDDIKLVAGSVPEVGANLVVNGDFEQAFTNGWQATQNFTNSYVDNTVSHSGSGSLHVVATAAGSGSGNAILQNVAVTNNGIYTVSYWYRPPVRGRSLTVRLSGSFLSSTPDAIASGYKQRLDNANWDVSLDEMRRWYCQNAVFSQRQLLEILTQFFENHFVTYQAKTQDYFDRYYDGSILDRIATDLEYREVSRWRNALAGPNTTFYDLLKISAESPAMIIYLDTVGSRGDGTFIANENYGRELLELFTMGVDNGYDQNDIVAMSRAWTGWTVGLVSRDNIDNPFAPQSTQYGNYAGQGYNAVSNIVGVWTFSFNPAWHGTNRAPILSVWKPNTETNPVALGPKIVPARFGPTILAPNGQPWAGQSYQLSLPRRPTGNTNGIQDGYDVIRHLADLPFTAEYLSVKLCRVFVHDDFPNPTTKVGLPEYAFYDYTDPNRTPEAELVRQCIVAWMTPGPDGRRGHIRSVLRTIFNSELFRSHAGSRQKVKTPLEFVISSIRSMYTSGTPTPSAFTDGNLSAAMTRMGNMSLFNRSDPDGYPEVASPWISAGTLTERLRFVQTLCTDPTQTGGRPGDAGNSTVDPVVLLQKKLSSTQQRDAGAVADYILNILFLGEGKANLDRYRTAAMGFLNSDNGGVFSAFSGLTVSTDPASAYDIRVRGMVAMLMTLQRFQEQ